MHFESEFVLSILYCELSNKIQDSAPILCKSPFENAAHMKESLIPSLFVKHITHCVIAGTCILMLNLTLPRAKHLPHSPDKF